MAARTVNYSTNNYLMLLFWGKSDSFYQVYYTTAKATKITTTNIAYKNPVNPTKMAADFELGTVNVSKSSLYLHY